jgi:hypothetical protein
VPDQQTQILQLTHPQITSIAILNTSKHTCGLWEQSSPSPLTASMSETTQESNESNENCKRKLNGEQKITTKTIRVNLKMPMDTPGVERQRQHKAVSTTKGDKNSIHPQTPKQQ